MRVSSRLCAVVAGVILVWSGNMGAPSWAGPPETEADLVIYGGTAAAVSAAVQARRMDRSVILVSPDRHLGGLTSGGLGWTDSGKKGAIGGLAREFYQRVYQHYQSDDAWRQQTRDDYGVRSQGDSTDLPGQKSMWVFEPHVAEAIMEEWVASHQIPVVREARLDRESDDGGVTVRDGVLKSFRTLDGRTYTGKMFLDCTYEGDLVAAAGVDTTFGREAASQYGETFNGNQVGILHHKHFFAEPVDPYVVPGDPTSGLLPRIDSDPPGVRGEADHRIQAYCFRMCLTDDPDNRIAFPKPDGYDPSQYELLLRVLDTGWDGLLNKFDPLPNRKTDTNNHGPFSTDNIGMNYDYPTASDARREEIIAEHETYQKGLMYFLANDPRVPANIREMIAPWGLCKDEFQETGGWPHQLYIREARRMVGQYVMTEDDCLDRRETPHSVGMGSYTLDSHNVRRYVTDEGYVQNEGDIGVHIRRPYEISYGSIVPRQDQCTNLLVPVCVSSTHIAFGSIRMEPVFMILGQSAATAAVMAIEEDIAVQELPYEKLRKRLLADKQILEYERPESSVVWDDGKGILVDDEDATFMGNWTRSTSHRIFRGSGYRHNEQDPASTAQFSAELEPGRYEVLIGYPAHKNRTRQALVQLSTSEGVVERTVDQTETPSINNLFEPIGTFDLGGQCTVDIRSTAEKGYLVVDTVKFVKK